MSRIPVFVSTSLLALLSCLMLSTASAQDGVGGSNTNQGPGLTSDVQDPVVELHRAREKREQASTQPVSLFPMSPLTPIRERGIAAEKRPGLRKHDGGCPAPAELNNGNRTP